MSTGVPIFSVYHIIYLSSAVTLFSTGDLRILMERSRQWNEAHDITGALFYRDGNFLQDIEGSESAVRECFQIVTSDPRHRDVSPLFQEEISARDFPTWTMAFFDLGLGGESSPVAFDDLLNLRNPQARLGDYTFKVKAFLKSFVR